MTRISMTIAAASLTLSLSPAAQAYPTEIDLDVISEASEVLNVVFNNGEPAPAGTCASDMEPELAVALGLLTDAGEPNPAVPMSFACLAG